MDTVYVLVGRIGQENLSTHAKKRLKILNELNDSLANLQKAYDEADDKDKATYQKQVEEAQNYLENYEEDFRVFLDEEHQDLQKKQALAAEKAAEKAAKKQAEADKAAAEAEANAEAQRLADEAEAQRLAAEEAEKAANAAAGKENTTTEPAKKKGLGIGTILIGVSVAALTLGAVNYFNKK